MSSIKISIIIPVYNMVDYIEQTILSILNQSYPKLEIIVIDGDSKDGTLDILNKYKSYFSVLVSEKDSGQYDAINKGLKLASGEVVAWLNADDVYFPWTLSTVNNVFSTQNDVYWVSGQNAFLDKNGNYSKLYNSLSGKSSKDIQKGYFKKDMFGYLQQEGMFWRKIVLNECGYLNTTYKLAADYELWIRFSNKFDIVTVELPLAAFRIRSSSRSMSQIVEYENEVSTIFKNLKSANSLTVNLYMLCSKAFLNKILRLLTWRKCNAYYFSVRKQRWEYKIKARSISPCSLGQLTLEL